MGTAFDLRPVLTFVGALKRNNRRDWFEDHRPQHDEARAQFEAYVLALITNLGRTLPLGALTPRDCIFRMHRDLRFSRDKRPYKPYMSAYIAPGGRKARRLGFYVHIEAGNHSIAGGGLHEPEPGQLAAWRAAIDRDPRPFRRIVRAGAFRRHFGEVRGERLKTAPRGYAKDHPDLDLLQLTRLTVWRTFSDREVVARTFLRESLVTFRAMKPFLAYLEGLE